MIAWHQRDVFAIEVDAEPAQAWAVLTDFQAYPHWNPFVRRVDGALEEGARLVVRVRWGAGRCTRFRATVLRVEPLRELRWRARLFTARLFEGEHVFALEIRAGRGVRLVQREMFRGALVPLAAFTGILDFILHGFERMNEAAKARIEQSTAPPA